MPRLVTPVNDQDHIQGPEDAAVTLVEYGDFECPYCGAAYPVLQQIREELGDELRFVFRHFPIIESHPHAELAAEAAECAAVQNAFWEYHDLLFEHQDALDWNSLTGYAKQLGLDVQRFEADLEGHRYKDKVYNNFMDGVRSGVNGTPTFFIDGHRYDGPADFESLLEALQERV